MDVAAAWWSALPHSEYWSSEYSALYQRLFISSRMGLTPVCYAPNDTRVLMRIECGPADSGSGSAPPFASLGKESLVLIVIIIFDVVAIALCIIATGGSARS
ncbi:hypothetical protein SNOG_10516 [Parastagonospora nodorum SN15]|uniref:Uncharacterized protein n=1 Tax=Phaeosphaeria nodorum (strain SN15 / ATCC MYA-4574 / FGSC 10173) TaxID=321614 RepID=Q0UCJ8_PHANO|nr:hypothetical protein SNOG_10516 [Parastagonospora nodorum SN15]EAT81910.1 hypothetical protein SNOG_10516 [Parastagonospora nodorum SN15]